MTELGPYATALAAAAEEAKVAAVTKPASSKHALVFKTFELTKGLFYQLNSDTLSIGGEFHYRCCISTIYRVLSCNCM